MHKTYEQAVLISFFLEESGVFKLVMEQKHMG